MKKENIKLNIDVTNFLKACKTMKMEKLNWQQL